ncbi:MAG TPA: hypothetical protein VGI20_12160 [Rhizomicrobium sp.]|jgi:hypothetical protein
MSGVFKPALLIALGLGLFGVDRASMAQGEPSQATKYALRGTYIDSGYYGANGLFVAPNNYTAIGNPLVLSCPGSAGTCTIQADLWIQSGKSDITRNWYNLCFSIDGALAPNCQIVGSTPADRTYANGSTSQLAGGIAIGGHTVQAYFLSHSGAFVFNYTSNYRVYTP